MSFEIKVPAVGESITEVTIAQWLKKDGDFVNPDDLICEIESDKASFEIPAEQAGILKILVPEGEIAQVGGNIARIEAGAANGKSAASKETTEAATPPAAVPSAPAAGNSGGSTHAIRIPTVGESITEVVLAQWLKKDGETVSADDLVCEIESDKASFEIPAEQAGVLRHKVSEGDTVEINAVIAEISGDGSATAPAATPAAETPAATSPAPAAAAPTVTPERTFKISPVAEKILQEAGLSPADVTGSGPGGRITKDDALSAIIHAYKSAGNGGVGTKAPAAPAVADSSGERETRRERLSSLRRTIAKRLVTVKNETAMLTTFNEVDMSAIKKLRGQYKEMFKEKHEVGLGFMSFFTKAVCMATKEWPAVNAMIDGDYIVYNDYCDVSIAVSTPRGLVVPVIRNADKMSLAEIEKEIIVLAKKARDGKLTIEEMTGGTFTITNGGVFGSMMSTPIINAPQSAILGMHNIVDRPVVVNGEVAVRPIMYLALSYDHRIIDGRESVSFLYRVKQLLEDPARMLLDI